MLRLWRREGYSIHGLHTKVVCIVGCLGFGVPYFNTFFLKGTLMK